jgi:hypothetical protein
MKTRTTSTLTALSLAMIAFLSQAAVNVRAADIKGSGIGGNITISIAAERIGDPAVNDGIIADAIDDQAISGAPAGIVASRIQSYIDREDIAERINNIANIAIANIAIADDIALIDGINRIELIAEINRIGDDEIAIASINI